MNRRRLGLASLRGSPIVRTLARERVQMSMLSFRALDWQQDLGAVTNPALACDDHTRALCSTLAEAADGSAFFADALRERTAAETVRLGAFENWTFYGISDMA